MLEVVGADDTLLTKTEEVTGGSADIDTGVVGVAKVVALELPAEGGELLVYGEPGLELEAGGDLLPDLLDDTLVRVFVLSFPFCCCLHFARLFLNQTCK